MAVTKTLLFAFSALLLQCASVDARLEKDGIPINDIAAKNGGMPVAPTTTGAETSVGLGPGGFSDRMTEYLTEILTETVTVDRIVGGGGEGDCLSGTCAAIVEVYLKTPAGNEVPLSAVANLTDHMNMAICHSPSTGNCTEDAPLELVDYYETSTVCDTTTTKIVFR